MVSLLVSLVVTPICRYIAYRTRIVDKPDDLLKPHSRPVAYLGGIGICVGLLAGIASAIPAFPNWPMQWEAIQRNLSPSSGRLANLLDNPLWTLVGIAVSCIIITIVGVLDDIWVLKPRQKIIGQALAAGILFAASVTDRMSLVILTLIAPVDSWPLWLVNLSSFVMGFAVVVATCNATNLLDGLDGLCGGVTSVIAFGFLALAVWLATWNRSPCVDHVRIVFCLAMAGGVLGFLPYNVPPASIFMGDAGSMLLGFFVAAMMGMFCEEGTPRWFLAAWVVFALPSLDTGLAVVRRLVSGKPIFSGDRSHLYDQLIDRGMSVTQVVALFYVLAIVAATVGVLSAIYLRIREAVVLYAAIMVFVWVVFYALGMIKPESRRSVGTGDKSNAAS